MGARGIRRRQEKEEGIPCANGQGATGARGTEAPAPTLWINGQRVGEAADLRGIPAASLKTIRYYSIEEAKLRFGMQNPGGAIELTYRTKPDP